MGRVLGVQLLHVRHCDNSVTLAGIVQVIVQSEAQAVFNQPHNTADMKYNSPLVVKPLMKPRDGKNSRSWLRN